MATRQPSTRASASPIPLAVGSGAVIISAALAVIVIATSSVPIRFVGVPLPIVQSDRFWLSLIGYLLTPIAAVIAVGWDRIAQRRGVVLSGNFVPNRGFEVALTWIAGAGLVLGVWHVLNLSVPLSEFWGVGR